MTNAIGWPVTGTAVEDKIRGVWRFVISWRDQSMKGYDQGLCRYP